MSHQASFFFFFFSVFWSSDHLPLWINFRKAVLFYYPFIRVIFIQPEVEGCPHDDFEGVQMATVVFFLSRPGQGGFVRIRLGSFNGLFHLQYL